MATDPKAEPKQDIKVEDDVPPSVYQLSDMFNIPDLTDMALKNPDTGSSVKVHKAILASGSRWFLKCFRESPKAEELKEADFVLHNVEVPRPIPLSDFKHQVPVSDEIVHRILKYIYHN